MDNENPYEDGPSPAPQADQQGEKEQDVGGEGLLPAAFFQGKELQPGTRCEIEITEVHGDEVAVKYVPHEEPKEETDEAAPEPAPQGDKELASMME